MINHGVNGYLVDLNKKEKTMYYIDKVLSDFEHYKELSVNSRHNFSQYQISEVLISWKKILK